MTQPTDIAAIAEGLTPLQRGALKDCCERGSIKTNDGGLIDTLLSGMCSKVGGGIINGWLVEWAHNHPRALCDCYMNKYTPTPLGLAVRKHLEAQQ